MARRWGSRGPADGAAHGVLPGLGRKRGGRSLSSLGVVPPTVAAAIMVGCLFLLAFQDGLVKIVSADISIWQFQAVRAVFNIALLALFAGWMWGGASPAPKRWDVVALRSLCMVFVLGLFFGAIPFLSLGEIAAGLYCFPLFVAVLSAAFLGEKVGPRRIAAIVAGFAGALLILKPGTDAFQPIALAPVAAGFFYAVNILLIRKLCREENPATLALGVSVALLLAGILGMIAVPLVASVEAENAMPYIATGWRELGVIAILLIMACSVLNLIANIGLAAAYQNAESSWLAPFDYSYLVFATFWGAVLFSERPDLLSLFGMSLIAAAGIYVAWRENRLAVEAARGEEQQGAPRDASRLAKGGEGGVDCVL